MRFERLLIAASGVAVLLAALNSTAIAQEVCVKYQLMPQTVYENKTVTRYRDVIETAYETEEKTDFVPVYSTEKRERVHVSYKPVKKTTMKEEEYTVYKPVQETLYREETYEETDFETVTEMRKERVVTEKPVVETRFREERVLVRKPVRKTEMRSDTVTTLRPVQTVETEFVPGTLLTDQVGPGVGLDRPRLDWLSRGYYWDSNEGQYVFRRRGFHWTQEPQATQTPVLLARPKTSTAYIPEYTRRETPVEVVDYDEQIEVRKIPVEVERTETTVEFRDVPVEVKKPVIRTRTRKVPYQNTRYEKVVKVRQVPVESMTVQKVETIEPYEKTTAKWVAKKRQVEVPRQVTRSVPYQTTIRVPRTIMMKVPVDQFGNILGPGVPVEEDLRSGEYYDRLAKAEAKSEPRRLIAEQGVTSPSVLERSSSDDNVAESGSGNRSSNQLRETSGRQKIQYDRPRVRETAKQAPVDAIIVPETIPTYQNAQTSLIEIRRRPKSLDETSGTSVSEGESVTEPGTPVRKRPIRILGEYEEGDLDPSQMNGTKAEELKSLDDLGAKDAADVPPAIIDPVIEAVDDLNK